MKTNIKKVLLALKDKDKGNLEDTFMSAIAYIDRAASKRVIHRNNAARKVSRLTKKVNAVLKEGQTQQ
jgi:small subunit ribosomal protein S20